MKDPADSLIIRGNPIWKCSKCDEGIYAGDIAFTFVATSKRRKDQVIKCPRCGYVDSPGEVRKYGK